MAGPEAVITLSLLLHMGDCALSHQTDSTLAETKGKFHLAPVGIELLLQPPLLWASLVLTVEEIEPESS